MQLQRDHFWGDFLLLPVFLGVMGYFVCAAPGFSEEHVEFERLKGFLEATCFECHDDLTREGGLDFFELPTDLKDPETLAQWTLIFDRVKSGEMPPREKARPDAGKKIAFLAALAPMIRAAESSKEEKFGRGPARRLTNFEYENTLHRMLGIDKPLQKYLIPNALATQFRNNTYEQQVSHYDVESYLAAADAALEEAYRIAFLNPWQDRMQVFPPERVANANHWSREPYPLWGGAIVWNTSTQFHGRISATRARHSGLYEFTIEYDGVNLPEGRPLWVTVKKGMLEERTPVTEFVTRFAIMPDNKRSTVTFTTWLPKGHRLEIRPNDRTLEKRVPHDDVVRGKAKSAVAPGIRIHKLTMQELVDRDSVSRTRAALFGEYLTWQKATPDEKGRWVWMNADRKTVVRELVHNFATMSFRRPVPSEELSPYMGIVFDRLDKGYEMHEALRFAYRAILLSPRFLFFQEGIDSLGEYELASRLSYFLWSMPPDQTLLDLAATGKLSDPEVRRSQVSRMIHDERFENFIFNFTNEWLDLDDIDETIPDQKSYWIFDETVKQALLDETRMYFQELLTQNQSVTRIVKSDYTFLDDRLARHYGIEGEFGGHMTKTQLPADGRRGGFLTQGAILKVTADGSHTSPILRGIWMLERILGDHVPPPPDEVPAVEPDIRGATTIREQLSMHRDSKQCAACHFKIDPPGFALENFDPIGQWRTHYWREHSVAKRYNKKAKPLIVEAHYETPDGKPFRNIADYKQILADDPERLANNLAAQMVTYATGMKIRFKDREAVAAITAEARDAGGEYRVRSILEEVVSSRIFATR